MCKHMLISGYMYAYLNVRLFLKQMPKLCELFSYELNGFYIQVYLQ